METDVTLEWNGLPDRTWWEGDSSLYEGMLRALEDLGNIYYIAVS